MKTSGRQERATQIGRYREIKTRREEMNRNRQTEKNK